MTDAPVTEHRAAEVGLRAGESGEVSASPPSSRPHTLKRAVAAHQLAAQGERELAWWGKPGSGFTLLGRAAFLGAVHVTSPTAVEAELQRLLAEVRGLNVGGAA